MLLMAVSRCWLFSESSRCAAPCWRCSWRTIREMVTMTTTTASAAAKTAAWSAPASRRARSTVVGGRRGSRSGNASASGPRRHSPRHPRWLTNRPDVLPPSLSACWNPGWLRYSCRQAVILRIAGDDGAVAMDHRDRGVVVQRERTRRNPRNGVGATPRLAKPMISPSRPTILRAKIVVHLPVTLLLAGSTMTSGVGRPEVNSWK